MIGYVLLLIFAQYGTNDDSCLQLAALCSQAVDYAKNGVPVDIHDSPRLLIPYKPDWHMVSFSKVEPSKAHA